MARKPKAVQAEGLVTELELEGMCPHCSATVWDSHNPVYCGTCGKKIRWNLKDEVAKYARENNLEHLLS